VSAYSALTGIERGPGSYKEGGRASDTCTHKYTAPQRWGATQARTSVAMELRSVSSVSKNRLIQLMAGCGGTGLVSHICVRARSISLRQCSSPTHAGFSCDSTCRAAHVTTPLAGVSNGHGFRGGLSRASLGQHSGGIARYAYARSYLPHRLPRAVAAKAQSARSGVLYVSLR
jgi:hypothetical protein